MLTAGLREQIANPQEVRRALWQYVDTVLPASPDTGLDWFAWLSGLDTLGNWLPEDARIRRAVAFLPVWMQRQGLPKDRDITQLLTWLQSGYHEAFLESEPQYLAAYDTLAETGDKQLTLLLPWLRNVTSTGYTRARYLRWLQDRAAESWEQAAANAAGAEAAYWEIAAQLRGYLAVCNETPDQLMDSRARTAAEGLLEQAFRHMNPTAAGYTELYRTRTQQPDDRFRSFWHQALVRAFTQHYKQKMAMPLESLNELDDLEKARTAIGAQDALLGSPQERYCRDVIAAAKFCTRLDSVNDRDLISQTRETIRCLQGHMHDQRNNHPLKALYRYCTQPGAYQKFRYYDHHARLSVALISTCWIGNGLAPKDLLKVLMGPGVTVPARPYAPESLPFLQTVVWLFDALKLFDSTYPTLLATALNSDPEMAEYTARLRANHALFYQYFPRFSPDRMTAEWQTRSPLSLWLNA